MSKAEYDGLTDGDHFENKQTPYEQGFVDGRWNHPSQVGELHELSAMSDVAYHNGYLAGKQHADEVRQYHMDEFAAGLL